MKKTLVFICLSIRMSASAYAQVPIPLNQSYYCWAMTHSPDTSALVNADSTPTYEVLEEATAASIVSGSLTLRTASVGEYYFTVAATVANGFELGKMYTARVGATVSSISDKSDCPPLRVVAAEATAGVPVANTTYFGGTLVTGRDLGASVLLSNGVGTAQVKLAAGDVSPHFSDITGTLDAAEIGAGAFTAVKFATNFLTSNGLDTTAATEIAAAVSVPTALAIADAVWDEVLSGHLTAGSTGASLNASASAGDPWNTAVPGAYGAGSAGPTCGQHT